MATTILKKITPTDIGAVAKIDGTMTGSLTIDKNDQEDQKRIVFTSPGINGQCQLVANTTGTQQRITFRQYVPDGSSFEEYALPNTADYTGGAVLRNILTDKSPVTSPQGGTGTTDAALYVTNNYTSILDVINTVRNTRIFPISIQKSGTALYSDMPTTNQTDEWNLLLIGNSTRITATLYLFGKGNERHIYVRDFYNGSWFDSQWMQIH